MNKREVQDTYSVVLPCAGIGSRMGLGYNKLLYVMKNGKTVIENTLDVFITDDRCKEMIVCISQDDVEKMKSMIHSPKIKWVLGGKTRQESVYHGLLEVCCDKVFIHDGARPYLKRETMNLLLERLKMCNACLPMVAVKDTIKEVRDGKVVRTPDRSTLYQAQTPQAFDLKTILNAHQKAIQDGYEGTDDASLVEALTNEDVYGVDGDYENIKITTPEDIF